MPIRQDDNQPNRRFGIVNIILIGVGALLLFSSLFPNQNMQIPRVPYSLFIDQVNDGEVKSCLLYTSPSPRDATLSRMPSSA